MRYTGCLILMFCLNYFFPAYSQEKKSVQAFPINQPLKTDGVLDEPEYKSVHPAADFVQYNKFNGSPSPMPTEVWFFYDQTSLYVGAKMYDSAPDSIFDYLSERDESDGTDCFGIYLDPYNQGQLAYGFFVTAADVQSDMKAIKREGDHDDFSWNAVWESKARITPYGWVVEMKIPYSAIRFPDKREHVWGMNMFRVIERYNSNNSWNFIDRSIAGWLHQQGEITGIRDIKPPVRFSVSPYAAGYAELNDKSSGVEFVYKGGMDLKYGINESFTLDMMLIPDFGQIQPDDKQLNLSPYELYYDEKRQFFTEGTELFQRGDIFYSRRIGSAPRFSSLANNELRGNETVDFNPSETQIVNATKVSGRTSKGWGLGLMNSMTLPSFATIKDTVSHSKRKVLVQPATNYNVSVVDKTLKNNSYISLINTNMKMFGNPFLSNVTATEFQMRDKSKTFVLYGSGGVSYQKNVTQNQGYRGKIGLTKNSGNYRFGASQSYMDDTYNPNDMGYLRRNNEMISDAFISYQILQPVRNIVEFSTKILWKQIRIYNPSDIFNSEIEIGSGVRFRNNYHFSTNIGYGSRKHDYYETRAKNRYIYDPYQVWFAFSSESDSRKSLSFSSDFLASANPKSGQRSVREQIRADLWLGQRLRFSYETGFNKRLNDRGYVDRTSDNDTIYIARRNVRTLENGFNTLCVINSKAGLSFRIRHYWSGAVNKEYFQLQDNGGIIADPGFNGNYDENYNALNIDLMYRWVFAPGSELSVLWSNSEFNNTDVVVNNYWDNFHNTFKTNRVNSLSVKALFYIDYNFIKKH